MCEDSSAAYTSSLPLGCTPAEAPIGNPGLPAARRPVEVSSSGRDLAPASLNLPLPLGSAARRLSLPSEHSLDPNLFTPFPLLVQPVCNRDMSPAHGAAGDLSPPGPPPGALLNVCAPSQCQAQPLPSCQCHHNTASTPGCSTLQPAAGPRDLAKLEICPATHSCLKCLASPHTLSVSPNLLTRGQAPTPLSRLIPPDSLL